jgi:hypothetical protein
VVAGEDVDRTDRRHVFAPYEAPAVTEGVDVLCQQPLEVGLDPVLDQPRVHPEIVVRVVEDLVQAYPEPVLGLGVLHDPDVGHAIGRLLRRRAELGHGARRRHPVERLVRAAVAVDEDGPVRLDHEKTGREGQMCGQPAVVVDAAPGDDDTHRGSLARLSRRSRPRGAGGPP